MPEGVEAVLGFESKEGPAEAHGEVESRWIGVRVMGVLERVGCRVLFSRGGVGRRWNWRDIVRDAMIEE